jgi:dihydrofolate synthase/folylpolyglutamate synthase
MLTARAARGLHRPPGERPRPSRVRALQGGPIRLLWSRPDIPVASAPATPALRTLDDATGWLRTFTDYEQKLPHGPAHAAFDLARVEALWRALGHPARTLPVLHITGTKGKTTTAILAEAVLRAHGVRSFRFVSPHVDRLEERFLVGGTEITGAGFAAHAARLRPLVDDVRAHDPGRAPTFFECLTLIGFLDAEARGARALVLEVGLGGRLDATNIVPRSTAIVTSIGLDHTRVLGATHEEIAREKAGILKPSCTAFTGLGPGDPGFAAIARAARERGCHLRAPGPELAVLDVLEGRAVDGAPRLRFGLRLDGCEIRDLELAAGPAHQAGNALLAVAGARSILSELGLPLDPRRTREGLACARLPGRAEWRPGPPPLLLDGAHTAESVAEALRTARRLAQGGAVHALLGLTRDRDPGHVFGALVGAVEAATTTLLPTPRSRDPMVLACDLAALGLPARAASPAAEALEAARAAALRAGALLLVTGSLYLVGEVRSALARLTSGPPVATIGP